SEVFDKGAVAGRGILVNGLQTTRSVDVYDRGYELSFFLSEWENLLHKGHLRILRALEPLMGPLRQDRRRERSKRLAELDGRVHDLLPISASRVEQDGPIAESTLAKFHSALEPAEDPAVEKILGGARRWIVDHLGARDLEPPGDVEAVCV